MHPSEHAAQLQELAWNRELGVPTVPPHTLQEWEVLDALDQARKDETRQLKSARRPVLKLA